MKKIIIFLTVLLVVGCAARKVNKSQVEVKQDTATQTNKKEETEIDLSFMWKKTFIPMNESLPFIVDGKKYQNVKIETLKIKKGVTTTKQDNSVLKVVISTKKNIETKEKKQERYNNNFSIFYWIVITIVGYITFDYYINKK